MGDYYPAGPRNDYLQNYNRSSGGNRDPPHPYSQYPQIPNEGYPHFPYESPQRRAQQPFQDPHPDWRPRHAYQHPPPAPALPPIQPPIQNYSHDYPPQRSFTVPPVDAQNPNLPAIRNLNSTVNFGGQTGPGPGPGPPLPLLPPLPGNFQNQQISHPRSVNQNQPTHNNPQPQAYVPQPASFQNTQTPLNRYEQRQPPPLHISNPYPGHQDTWPPLRPRHLPEPSTSSSVRSTTPSTPPSRSSSRRSSFTPSSFDDDNYSRPRRSGDFRSRFRNSHELRRVGSPVSPQYQYPEKGANNRPEFRNANPPRSQNEDPDWIGGRPRTPSHPHFQNPQYPHSRPLPIPRRARPELDLSNPSTGSILGRIRDTGAQRNERAMAEGREWKRQRRAWGPAR